MLLDFFFIHLDESAYLILLRITNIKNNKKDESTHTFYLVNLFQKESEEIFNKELNEKI